MKKQYILLGVLVLLVAGLTVLSVNKYQHRSPTLTVKQATSQRDTALRALQIHDQINKNTVDGLNNQLTDTKAQNTALTTQKATLCTQIKAAKLVQPLCQ